MTQGSIIEGIKKCTFHTKDEATLLESASSPSYITTTQFIKCHQILVSSNPSIDVHRFIWRYLYHKIYQYQPGILLMILKSKMSKQLGMFEILKFLFLCSFHKKKDTNVFSAIGEFLDMKISKLVYNVHIFSLKKAHKGRLRIGQKFKLGKHNFFNIDRFDCKIEIEDDVEIRNFCSFRTDEGGSIKLGKNVFINNYCSINALENIEIGSFSILGEGVRLYDHNHAYERKPNNTLNISANTYSKARIKIGNHCWIGSNVVILKGVSIGDNVIIGANNLIFKSVESNSIVVAKQEQIIKNI